VLQIRYLLVGGVKDQIFTGRGVLQIRYLLVGGVKDQIFTGMVVLQIRHLNVGKCYRHLQIFTLTLFLLLDFEQHQCREELHHHLPPPHGPGQEHGGVGVQGQYPIRQDDFI
jgi:hypothetical protein